MREIKSFKKPNGDRCRTATVGVVLFANYKTDCSDCSALNPNKPKT